MDHTQGTEEHREGTSTCSNVGPENTVLRAVSQAPWQSCSVPHLVPSCPVLRNRKWVSGLGRGYLVGTGSCSE